MNRVVDEYPCYVKTEGSCLDLGGMAKWQRGDHDGRDASPFEIVNIVHTARGTGSSIRESFDHSITFACNLVTKVDGCRFGKGWLGVALYMYTDIGESHLEPIEEDISSGLRDIE